MVEHLLDDLGVAADRNALVRVVEVVVVEGEAHRQAADDEARQVLGRAAPLLGGVVLDQLGVDIGADQ